MAHCHLYIPRYRYTKKYNNRSKSNILHSNRPSTLMKNHPVLLAHFPFLAGGTPEFPSNGRFPFSTCESCEREVVDPAQSSTSSRTAAITLSKIASTFA